MFMHALRLNHLAFFVNILVSALLTLSIKHLPECLVLKRWTKAAKDCIVLPHAW